MSRLLHVAALAVGLPTGPRAAWGIRGGLPSERAPRRSLAPDYGRGPSYWDGRYLSRPEPYDWLEGYPKMRFLTELLPGGRAARVLHAGCGNSLMPEQMYDEGFQHLVSIDTSSVVIKQMAARSESRPGMRWLVMDATRMDFDDGEFDAVIDKSLLDTLDCEEDDPAPVIGAYLREVARVLKPGGVFLCVSLGIPASRLPYFEAPGVEFDVSSVQISPRLDFAYVARLRPKAVEPGPAILAARRLEAQRFGGPHVEGTNAEGHR